MKHRNIIFSALAAATIAGPAFADATHVELLNFSPHKLTVTSNWKHYTKLENTGGAALSVAIDVDAEISGRIKSIKVRGFTNMAKNMIGNLNEFSNYSEFGMIDGAVYERHFPIGQRPKTFKKTVPVGFNVQALKKIAKNSCNKMAGQLRKAGLTDKEIFSKTRKTAIMPFIRYDVQITGINGTASLPEVRPFPRLMEVICKKSAGGHTKPQGGGTKITPVKVLSAKTQMKQIAKPAGTCKLSTQTAIRTNEPNRKFKYHFEHSSGAKSKTYTGQSKGNSIAVVSHSFDVPIVDGAEGGWIQMKGSLPYFKANKMAYIMNCTKAKGFKAPGSKRPHRPATNNMKKK